MIDETGKYDHYDIRIFYLHPDNVTLDLNSSFLVK